MKMQIRESNYYVKWYCGLKDGMAKARIDVGSSGRLVVTMEMSSLSAKA